MRPRRGRVGIPRLVPVVVIVLGHPAQRLPPFRRFDPAPPTCGGRHFLAGSGGEVGRLSGFIDRDRHRVGPLVGASVIGTDMVSDCSDITSSWSARPDRWQGHPR
jgi:hypothetical protein